MRHIAIISLVVLLALPAPSAKADGESFASQEASSSIIDFTRSMTGIYITSETCQQIASLHFEIFSDLIKNYLTLYYHNNVPPWVLPDVSERIKNVEQCLFAMDERIATYQLASRRFSEEYEDAPVPPTLSMSMLHIDTNSTTTPARPPAVIIVNPNLKTPVLPANQLPY